MSARSVEAFSRRVFLPEVSVRQWRVAGSGRCGAPGTGEVVLMTGGVTCRAPLPERRKYRVADHPATLQVHTIPDVVNTGHTPLDLHGSEHRPFRRPSPNPVLHLSHPGAGETLAAPLMPANYARGFLAARSRTSFCFNLRDFRRLVRCKTRVVAFRTRAVAWER